MYVHVACVTLQYKNNIYIFEHRIKKYIEKHKFYEYYIYQNKICIYKSKHTKNSFFKARILISFSIIYFMQMNAIYSVCFNSFIFCFSSFILRIR